MEKDHNPKATEIALPLNLFPVQSGFREKKKINDLVAAMINISISIPAQKKITHLSIRHQSKYRGNCPSRECVSCTIRI